MKLTKENLKEMCQEITCEEQDDDCNTKIKQILEIQDDSQNLNQLISLGQLERDGVYVGVSKEILEKAKKWDMECNLSCSNGTSTEYATRLEKEKMEQSFKITDLEYENKQLKAAVDMWRCGCEENELQYDNLKQKQEQINYATLHAGCTVRLPDCIMCKVQEILKGKK